MNIKEAMEQRHMVRKYTEKAIPNDLIKLLETRVEENNQKYNLNIKLMINNEEAIGTIVKMILAKNVKNYFIMAGDKSEDLDERLGYAGADLILYAQTLGLNTWWIGGMFNRSTAKYVDNKKVSGTVAIGYGETNGIPHKSKSYEEVAKYDGNVPEWFKNGIKGALLAPTALNKQDFKIIGNGNKVKIENNNGIFTGINRGLIKYHFELGAGSENFKWE